MLERQKALKGFIIIYVLLNLIFPNSIYGGRCFSIQKWDISPPMVSTMKSLLFVPCADCRILKSKAMIIVPRVRYIWLPVADLSYFVQCCISSNWEVRACWIIVGFINHSMFVFIVTFLKFTIPGTLLEIVAGRTTIGILNALYLSLALYISWGQYYLTYILYKDLRTYFLTTAVLSGRLQNHQ